jgi:carboxylesterase
MPGAEPFSASGGPAGALLLHGFGGNPSAMRPLAERLAAAGYTVEAPALPGHGTAVEELLPRRWLDWLGAARQAFDGLVHRCHPVAVVGHSMGGTLACALAEARPEVAGIAVVNPLVEPPDDEMRRGIHQLMDQGIEVLPGEGPDLADGSVAPPAYPGTALGPLLSLFDGVEEVALNLSAIRCPVLLLSSRVDHVLPTTNGDLLMASVSGPAERVWLERSFHAAMLDYDRPEVEARIIGFVESVTAAAAATTPPSPAEPPSPVTPPSPAAPVAHGAPAGPPGKRNP